MKETICTGYKSRRDGTYAGINPCVCEKSCVYWSYDGCTKKDEFRAIKINDTKKELDDFLNKKREKMR